MHGKIVAQCRSGCDWIVFVLPGQIGKPVVDLLIDYRALFNPPDLIFFCLDLEKTLVALKHLQLLPVYHLGHARRNRGHAVVKIHLPR